MPGKQNNMTFTEALEAFRDGRITREAAASRLAEGLNEQEDINFFLNRPQRAIDRYAEGLNEQEDINFFLDRPQRAINLY